MGGLAGATAAVARGAVAAGSGAVETEASVSGLDGLSAGGAVFAAPAAVGSCGATGGLDAAGAAKEIARLLRQAFTGAGDSGTQNVFLSKRL